MGTRSFTQDKAREAREKPVAKARLQLTSCQAVWVLAATGELAFGVGGPWGSAPRCPSLSLSLSHCLSLSLSLSFTLQHDVPAANIGPAKPMQKRLIPEGERNGDGENSV